MNGFPQNWIDAARYERDRRTESLPKAIAEQKITEEAANLDYQAWCAIAEWLERGKASWPAAIGWWGGVADPPETVITWALLEERAEKQLASIEQRLAGMPAEGAKLPELRDRRDAIWCIHNLLVKQRELIEPTAREETAWARPPAELANA